jgi:hypothetical protein
MRTAPRTKPTVADVVTAEAVIGPLDSCVACHSTTRTHYHGFALCWRCARARGRHVLSYLHALTRLADIEGMSPVDALGASEDAVRALGQLTDALGRTLTRRLDGSWVRATGRCVVCGAAHA